MTQGQPSGSYNSLLPLTEGLAPFSQEAEQAVIGAVLVSPDIYLTLASFLHGEDFYVQRHGMVWDAMRRINERGERIDYVTVVDELRGARILEEIGGTPYLLQLANNTPSAYHAESYARLVERAALRRRLLTAAEEIKALARDETLATDKVITESEQRLFRVTERGVQREILDMQSAISAYFERIEYLYNHPNEPLGLPTGFKDFDKMMGGLQRSDLLIFAGRPGMGKSSFLLSMALNSASLFNARVLIFTLEMGHEQIVQRLISMETGINTQKMRTGQFTPQEWAKFVHATGRLSNLQIFIDDSPALTPIQMRTKCRRVAHEYGLDLVILDYVQLMNSGGTYENNRVQEISYISRSVKELARELNVPVFTAAQLSRAVEQRQDKRPQLSDLRESGCLDGDARVYLPATGEYTPIRDLAGRSGFEVLSLNPDTWKLESSTVSAAFCTGVKPVYRLTTQLGRTIRATGNHQFLTIDGWKRLDSLTSADRLALPRSLPENLEQTLSNAELALLGHMIGDGCTLPRHAIQYTTRELDLAEGVVAFATECFGNSIRPRIVQEKNHTWYQVFLSASERLTHGRGNPVATWLRSLDAFGLRSYEKFVPQAVFQQPVYAIAVFLRHLWATDGSVGLKKTTVGEYPNVYYATSSGRLAHDVQSLLLRLGINARMSCVPQGNKGRAQYHVSVTGISDLQKFANVIGAAGAYRQNRLKLVESYVSAHIENTNRDVIPYQVWRKYAVPAMQAKKLTGRAMQAAMGHAYCGTTVYKQNVSRQRAEKLAQVVESDALAQLAASDVYWDQIVSIVPDGETDVYDLTVPGHHNFVCADIICHNSLEQDADIVAFLYRDSVYNENSESPNKADIIVAKHRNGPTGTVSLYFENSLTKFTDYRTQTVDMSQR